jgi:peptidoglycan/LPS O-acetylase OafA/YrhL
MPSSANRLQFFDCLRALAISVVLIHHYYNEVAPGGSIGVSIFFVLSGYLITNMLLKEPVMDWRAAVRFLVRRFFRVWPPYLVAAVIVLAMMYIAADLTQPEQAAVYADRAQKFSQAFLEQIAFIRNPTWLGMGAGVFWTLEVEFWFYVTMPLIALVVGRSAGLVAALAAFLFAALALRFVSASWALVPTGTPTIARFVVAWFDSLILGSLLAAITYSRPLPQVTRAHFNVLSGACVAALVVIVLFVSNQDRIVWLTMASTAGLITALWMAGYLAYGEDVDRPIIAWFGRISYSVYLVHAILLDYRDALAWPLPDTFKYSKTNVLIASSILLAIALHYSVEKPAIALGRRLTRRAKATG